MLLTFETRGRTYHNIQHDFYLYNVEIQGYPQTWSLTYTFYVLKVNLQTL